MSGHSPCSITVGTALACCLLGVVTAAQAQAYRGCANVVSIQNDCVLVSAQGVGTVAYQGPAVNLGDHVLITGFFNDEPLCPCPPRITLGCLTGVAACACLHGSGDFVPCPLGGDHELFWAADGQLYEVENYAGGPATWMAVQGCLDDRCVPECSAATACVTDYQIEPCYPDLNGNCMVDVSDLVMVILDWGTPGVNGTDLDGSGVVDVADLIPVILNWGPCIDVFTGG